MIVEPVGAGLLAELSDPSPFNIAPAPVPEPFWEKRPGSDVSTGTCTGSDFIRLYSNWAVAVDNLTSKTLTGVVPTSVTVKLLTTLAGGTGAGTTCNNAAATATGTLANGTTAFRTTLHATPVAGSYASTETPFTPATLSAGELASITGRCASIIGNASGFGICNSCRTGALGGGKL
jgi:hypothetical protein